MTALVRRVAMSAACMLTLLSVIGGTSVATADGPAQLYLETEHMPYLDVNQHTRRCMLTRELARQALAIAARDELNQVVRDESLGEIVADPSQVTHLALLERYDINTKKWELRLIAIDPASPGDELDWWEQSALWQATYDVDSQPVNMMTNAAEVMTGLIDGDLQQALSAGGIELGAVTPMEVQPPDEAIEAQLLTVDYIPQFAAVRKAHEALAAGGRSPEWEAVLVRGYANLGLLTQHQWNAVSSTFFARALLYAERMVEASADAPTATALWHRAYARALVGLHGKAIEDLDAIEQMSTTDAAPEWSPLLRPYCEWKRKELHQVADDSNTLKPWALRLWFQLTANYRYPEWIYHSGVEVAQAVPTVYGVYADMAQFGHSLAATRTGANYAPAALSHFSVISLDALEDLPEEVKSILPTDEVKAQLLARLVSDPEPQDQFTPLPAHFGQLLQNISKQEPAGGLTWSALGYLLKEEAFVQAANYLSVSLVATERSHAEDVDRIVPTVGQHPYIPYLQSFRYHRVREKTQREALAAKLHPQDVTARMGSLCSLTWNTDVDGREDIGRVAYNTRTRLPTAQGLLTSIYPSGMYWRPGSDMAVRMVTSELRAYAPNSEIPARIEIGAVKEPTLEQLQEWEDQLHEDSEAFRMLAAKYCELGDNDAAILNLRRSLILVPTYTAAEQLADIYLRGGDRERWEKLWKSFLKTPDTSSNHYFAQLKIAETYCNWGEWKKAKPFILEAAQVWGTISLGQAGFVLEGLGEWEQSEYWMREQTTNYATQYGWAWYYWCCRTGRGNEQEALQHAQRYYELLKDRHTRSDEISKGVFALLQSQPQQALEHYKNSLKDKPSYTCTLMLAQLARDLGADVDVEQRIATVRKHYTDNPDVGASSVAAGDALLDLLTAEEISDNEVNRIGELVRNVDEGVTRCAFAYLFANELERLGKSDEALLYWRRALVEPQREAYYSTLAGRILCDKLGTSRKTRDVLDEDDLWGPDHPPQQ